MPPTHRARRLHGPDHPEDPVPGECTGPAPPTRKGILTTPDPPPRLSRASPDPLGPRTATSPYPTPPQHPLSLDPAAQPGPGGPTAGGA
jgi:hypothetical protein